mgnify:CR=1 FL=1
MTLRQRFGGRLETLAVEHRRRALELPDAASLADRVPTTRSSPGRAPRPKRFAAIAAAVSFASQS